MVATTDAVTTMRTDRDVSGSPLRRLLLLAALLLAPSNVVAHARVVATSIEDGSRLATAPAAFDVAFSAAVGMASIVLRDGDGEAVALDYTPPRERGREFSVPLPALDAGSYRFEWRTLSADGHVMSGSIEFTLAP